MYYFKKPRTTTINRNVAYKGETIEQKIRRIVNNKEPITDGAPLIYEERGTGVKAAHDIRTDRWEIAVDATDKITKAHIAKRQGKQSIGEQAQEGMNKEGEVKDQSAPKA